MSHRIERVNELIKQELGNILIRESVVPDVLVTIVGVETSPDLSYSKVSLSIFPEKKAGSTLKALVKGIYRAQQELNKRLYMKPVPKIRYVIDKSGEHFTRVNKAIDDNSQ